jgi:hypothetical protein
MKPRIISGMVLAASLGLFAGQSANAQNLLVNPGFETGNFAGWTLSGSTAFEGVSSTFATTPYAGSYSAFFGAVGSYNVISQTIATTPGDTYNISFALDNSGGPFSEAYLNWGGTQVWDLQPSGTFGWTQFGLNEQAAGSSITVSFGFEQVPSYFNLDNTSVVDLSQNGSFTPILNTTGVGNPIPDPVKPDFAVIADQGVGLLTSAATLLGLCAIAGYRSRRQTA